MGSLTTALINAGASMDVMEQAMSVIQNNVVNASTPGYVTQRLTLNAQLFDPSQGVWGGGVQAGAVVSSRNQYAEENVWTQNTLLGAASQQASSLSALENLFSISGQAGIPSALSSLYSAFSAWSANPQSVTSQQQVLSAAQGLAQVFNQTSTDVGQLEQQTNEQLQTTVDQINQLTGEIAGFNNQIRTGSENDSGLQTQLYNSLETLSGLVNIQVQKESDGTMTVLMNGQVPLVLGATAQQLQVSYPSAQSPTYPGGAAHAEIISAGNDVTQQVTAGQLGGLLQFRNTALPSVIGDQSQKGALNQLAQAVADRVNQLLESGQTPSGNPGTPLFTYDATSPTSVAQTLALAPNFTVSDLAPVDPGPPAVANGIASQLAALATPTNPADMLNGQSYTDFYGSIATDLGNQASSANTLESTQSDLLSQAQNLRAQVSGVSLNEQAANLMQFQQAYEAAAQMINVINTTTQYLMDTVSNL